MSDPYILVVDDDPGIRSLVVSVLMDEAYHVSEAENGFEALALVRERRPALVLLDMRMPVMDGWQFASRLQEEAIDLQILVMTAANNAARWAAEIGAHGYIAKPFDLDDLLQRVAELWVRRF